MRQKRPRARVPNAEISALVRAHRFAVSWDKLHFREQRRVLVWLLARIQYKRFTP